MELKVETKMERIEDLFSIMTFYTFEEYRMEDTNLLTIEWNYYPPETRAMALTINEKFAEGYLIEQLCYNQDGKYTHSQYWFSPYNLEEILIIIKEAQRKALVEKIKDLSKKVSCLKVECRNK